MMFKPIRFAFVVFIVALFASGCSSSSDAPSPSDTGDVSNPTQIDIPEDGITRVTFDITVPAYASNSLQVSLVLDDISTNAVFVVDESWTLVEELPSNTNSPLIVTFSDDNGGITLGRFETDFRTGTSATETFQITADQFDTESFDSDNDGISNLNELIAGTDPIMADSTGPDSEDQTLLPAIPIQADIKLVQDKTFRISWQPSEGATFYRVLENPDGISGFSQISDNLASSAQTFDRRVALYENFNASYIVQACNTSGCIDSSETFVSGGLEEAIGYFKASNTEFENRFGNSVSISLDGNTLAVGASGSALENRGGETDGVYVFQRINGSWIFEAILTSDTVDGAAAGFAADISLAGDGNTLAVGASLGENAVYVFERIAGNWEQQTIIEVSNSESSDEFGESVSLSADGTTLAIGAIAESSSTTGVNGNANDNSAFRSGAVYVFKRRDEDWEQQAFIKASNTDSEDFFGNAVSLSRDGNTLAVAARSEDSAATGIDGDQSDNSGAGAGAVYIFKRVNEAWQQESYLKASNAGVGDLFGFAISLSSDGNTLAVGASAEGSGANGINGDENDPGSIRSAASGAVYIFTRANAVWQQQAYVKASNPGSSHTFGIAVSLSEDGDTLAVGAPGEDSTATGLNGSQISNRPVAGDSGSAYVFKRSNVVWQQISYVKASNAESGDRFGSSVSLSGDGLTLVVGAENERSSASGIFGDQDDNTETAAGAVYLY